MEKYSKNSTIIEHKGKKIAYLDYRNLKKPDDFKAKVGETIERTNYYYDNNIKDILVLTDLTGSFIYGDAPKYLKQSTKLGKPFVKKSAVIGLSGAKRVILNMINVFSGYQTKAFSSIEEAKDWLAK